MTTCGSEKSSYLEQATSHSVEEGAVAGVTKRRCRTSDHQSANSRWISCLVGIVFGFMIVVVTRQQFQIYTMQRELNDLVNMEDLSLQLDGMPEDEIPGVLEKLTADQNSTLNAIVSRHRRQSNRDMTVYAYAHLAGCYNTQAWPTFYWESSPTYYANVDLHMSNGNVRALRVLCSGWYYVYAQIPYFYNGGSVGHEIVRVSRCGNGQSVTLLKTVINMPGGSTNNDWKYLGGIVYLGTSDHVEVRPSYRINHDYINNAPSAIQQGTFFGLYLIRHITPLNCISRCQSGS